MLQFYRYFLGIRPIPEVYATFQRLAEELGLPVRLDLLHLTLCVIAQVKERDRFIAGRVRRALRDEPLHSFPVNLSRVKTGRQGAFAHTFGRQDEIQDFYRFLVRLLLRQGIEPMHRKSGLHPHVTLTREALEAELVRIALRWFPTELLLIESEVGLTRHNVLASWPLLAPRQSLLFGDDLIAAASPARRSAA